MTPPWRSSAFDKARLVEQCSCGRVSGGLADAADYGRMQYLEAEAYLFALLPGAERLGGAAVDAGRARPLRSRASGSLGRSEGFATQLLHLHREALGHDTGVLS